MTGMLFCLLFLTLQLPIERAMLEEEDARVENPVVLLEALKNPDVRIQRIAVRAIGRFERAEFADAIRPLLNSPDARIRMETLNAFGQMNAPFDFRPMLESEESGAVRAVLYETIGRMRDVAAGTEEFLARALKDSDLAACTGAVKGLEALFRLHREMKPSEATLLALRDAIRTNTSATLRELALLTLNSAGDANPATLALAIEDPEPQVRRLGVIGSKQWKGDPSPIVRYEALKLASNCERAAGLLRDASDHVALLAIDQLGNGCNAKTLERIVDSDKDWRRQARALVSLAKVDPDAARKRLPKFVDHAIWQVRAYAAATAKILKDDRMLLRLSRDNHPNVIAAAISTPRDAVRALDNPDYGLVHEAAQRLKGWEEGRMAVTALLSALDRITREKKATSRDPRTEILQRLREFGDIRMVGDLRPLVADFDPVVAKLTAAIITEKAGASAEPRTRSYVPTPLPPDAYIRGLNGATAEVKMKEAGAFKLQLFADEAPATVARFADLVEKGHYNGLLMHRVVPNFVLQGGSPGANEYVGIGDYMRDELGLVSHVRGTLGISTRGRDTGDGQIFVNLVDNFRLDHSYTVFAKITEGMENVDKIQEGDVIESIEIRKKVQPQ